MVSMMRLMRCIVSVDTSREEQIKKKVVVVTARVHPGESQASWMMKGLLDYITSSDHTAHVTNQSLSQ